MQGSFHVIMTASITPSVSARGLSRVDPRVRLADYQDALRFWLTLRDPRLASLTLVENSGSSLYELRKIALAYRANGVRVEIRHLGDNDIPDGVSYGYAELGMLDRAVDECTIFGKRELVIKATGRLRFPSLPRLLDSLPENVQFVGDVQNLHLPWQRTPENGSIRTQLIGFSPDFYRKYLYGLRHAMKPLPGHRLIENVLYRALCPLQGNAGVLLRYPKNCPPIGIGAHWNKDYGSTKERCKNVALGATRNLTPWLWL